MSEHDCLECRRYKRQIEAMEGKLRLQAAEWARITGELDGYRAQEERRRVVYSSRARKGASARWRARSENA